VPAAVISGQVCLEDLNWSDTPYQIDGLTMSARGLLALLACLGLSGARAWGEEPAKPSIPAGPLSYHRTIRPIFQQHCAGCHQPAKSQGSYVITTHSALLKPGESEEPSVVAGKPDKSVLVQQIVPHGGDRPAMPKGQPPLSDREVELIKTWIHQGAKDDSPSSARTLVDADHPPTYALPPVLSSIAYSPNGKLLAVSGYHEVLLHKPNGSGIIARLVGLSERVQSLAFSPDGKWLAVSGGDPGRLGEVQIWNVAKRKLKLSLPVTYDTVYGVSWSPDGKKVAFGCSDNTLRAIDAETGQQVLFQGAHNDWVLETVFSVDGSYVVSVSRDRSMKLIEVATQRFVDNITSITPGALKGGLMTVARHPQRDELLIGGADGEPKTYRMHRIKKRLIGDDFNRLWVFGALPGRIFCARYSPDGNRIAVGSSSDGHGEVRVYQAAPEPTESRLVALCGLPAPITHQLTLFAVLPDFRKVGRLVAQFEGQRGAVYTIAFRPDGKVVASAGFDGVVRLNNSETGKLIKEFVPVPMPPSTVANTTTHRNEP
jgi:WD40 repeat protein/mono/diheme cytochrome c family protein